MEAPISLPTKDFQVAGISRSGRVRKKSSKLLDFESPEEIEKRTKRPGRPAARYPGRGRPPNALREREQELALAYELDDDDDDDDVVNHNICDMDHAEQAPAIGGTVDLHGALMNSDDELDTLVQDLVEGVEAEASFYTNDSRVRQSLYMREKTNKRKVLKDGGKVQRKDKGRSRFTAYSLWAREVRKRDFPDLDFANAARRLSELWANVSNKDKNAWRRKAKSQATKARTREKNAPSDMPFTATQSMTSNGNSFTNVAAAADATESTFMNRPTTSRTKKLAADRRQIPVATPTMYTSTPISTTPPSTWAQSRQKRTSNARAKANQVAAASTSNQLTNTRGSSSISASQHDLELGKERTQQSGIEAIDAAAHLKLLGESLTVIGERLKEHNGHVALSGSLSVLLDSLLCSMGPLLCMTTQIPGLENKKQLSTNLATTLDNIAYVMPGL